MGVCFSPCLFRIHWMSSCHRSPVDSHILNRKHNFKRPSSLLRWMSWRTLWERAMGERRGSDGARWGEARVKTLMKLHNGLIDLRGRMQLKLVHPYERQRSHWRTMKAAVMRRDLLSIWGPQHSGLCFMAANQELQEAFQCQTNK